MAWCFGESWDLYTASTDAVGYWDVTTVNPGSSNFQNNRFLPGGHSLGQSSNTTWIKTSGVNDAVHHFNFAFDQSLAVSGTSYGLALTLYDGTTAQCSVAFRSDGLINFNAGAQGGTTVLATWPTGFSLRDTWYSFEIEIVIHNTAGSITIRRNGNSVADFTATGLNTRGSANNYANKLQIGAIGISNHFWDDLLWRSDASSVPWIGDIRCVARMPLSDTTATFSRFPATILVQNTNYTGNSATFGAGVIRACSMLSTMTGTVASLTFNINSAVIGHVKMALYADVNGFPAGLLASSAELTNPVAGFTTFTVTGGPTVTIGTRYWVALWSDAGVVGNGGDIFHTNDTCSVTLTYTTSFPSSMAGASGPNNATGFGSNGMNIAPAGNFAVVQEAQEDAFTTYAYDSNPGDADFYTIGSIPTNATSIFAVTTRGYMIKTDAGSRTAAVQMKSASVTVATPTVTLVVGTWQWASRTDVTDPNTGSPWTASAVNAITIGPLVVS